MILEFNDMQFVVEYHKEDKVYTCIVDKDVYVEQRHRYMLERMLFAYSLSESEDFMYEVNHLDEDEIEKAWDEEEYIQAQHDLYDVYSDLELELNN